MIKSMTGYGKAETMLDAGKLTVEIRSLNGKTADISIKTSILPKDKELSVRQYLASELQRGNIDLFITYEPNTANEAKQINVPLLTEYYRQIREIELSLLKGYGKATMPTSEAMAIIMRFPDVLDTRKQDVINEGNWQDVFDCIRKAVAGVNEFRSQEGEVLYRDVVSKVENIMQYSREIETFEKERIISIKEKIISRFQELSIEPDPVRLEQEMIFYIEKLDINEEKVRLRQHCKYFMDTIDNDPFPGKKLGFITQEMGREINTTGSKANNTEIQRLVVKMKDELEKIKEQSLNIL